MTATVCLVALSLLRDGFSTSKACHLIIDYRLSSFSKQKKQRTRRMFNFCLFESRLDIVKTEWKNILLHVITPIHTHVDSFPSKTFRCLRAYSIAVRMLKSFINAETSCDALVRTNVSNFSSLTCPQCKRKSDTVTRSLCFYFETRFAHLFRDMIRLRTHIFVREPMEKESNWCFISWSWLLKKLYSVWIWIYADGWKQQTKNRAERGMKWFIFRHLPLQCLEMLRRCRFIFTVIEATTLRSKLFRDESRGGICCYSQSPLSIGLFHSTDYMSIDWYFLQRSCSPRVVFLFLPPRTSPFGFSIRKCLTLAAHTYI